MSTESFRALFVVGCPRSGTTWLQLLLAQHPVIATAPETQIFAYYLDRFVRQWREEHDGQAQQGQGKSGLSRLLSAEEFDDLCRLNATVVLQKIAARRPGAKIVVEKSPRHALSAGFIRRLFPDALILHVVRDPRDAAVSLMAASRGWGKSWAPPNVIEAARTWREHVLGAQRARGPRYREVRYEDLVESPDGELADVFRWLGIAADPAFCRRAVQACELSRLRAAPESARALMPAQQSPPEFFRAGGAGGWRQELDRARTRIVEHICGPLMREYGYERSVPDGRLPLRIPVHDALVRVREAVDWQLQRLTDHL